MWPSNPLTDRLKLRFPIIQAPMGIITTPALAAAVSNAGGLGGIGMWGLSAEDAGRHIAGFRQQSDGSLNVNYPIWPDPAYTVETSETMRRHLQSIYDAKGLGGATAAGTGQRRQPRACRNVAGAKAGGGQLSFRPTRARGRRSDQVRRHLHRVERNDRGRGANARAARRRRGHRPGHRGRRPSRDVLRRRYRVQPGLFSLLPQVVDAVSVPVIAAGGIADGRTAAAAFILGASAVQLGTAFMRCEEANMYDAHRVALATADDSCTLVTDLISGRPARYIRNKLIEDLVGSGLKPLPVPAQLSLTFPLGAAGDRDWAVLLSGQSAALTKDTNAAELVQRLAEETARRLRAFA
jgi:nitronate monooxygenase